MNQFVIWRKIVLFENQKKRKLMSVKYIRKLETNLKSCQHFNIIAKVLPDGYQMCFIDNSLRNRNILAIGAYLKNTVKIFIKYTFING